MKKKWQILCLVILCLFTTQCFMYKDWNPTTAGQLSHFIYGGILLAVFVDGRRYTKLMFGRDFRLIYLFSFLSLVSLILIYGESITKFYQIILPWSIFLLYFFFWKYQFKEKILINTILGLGFVTFIIQIIQLCFPSLSLFGVHDVDNLEVRNGILRFRLDFLFYFSIFGVMYYWERFVYGFKYKYLTLFLLFFSSLYLYLSRQLLFVVIVTIMFSPILSMKKSKKTILIISSVIFIFILFYNISALFGEFIMKTETELNDDNIRYIGAQFFLEKSLNTPFTFIFGNGVPQIEAFWKENYSLYTSDVGIIGQLFNYGIIRIVIFFVIVYRLLVRHASALPLYLKMFILCTFIDSILIFPFQSQSHALVWISVVYLSERSIIRAREKGEDKMKLGTGS